MHSSFPCWNRTLGASVPFLLFLVRTIVSEVLSYLREHSLSEGELQMGVVFTILYYVKYALRQGRLKTTKISSLRFVSTGRRGVCDPFNFQPKFPDFRANNKHRYNYTLNSFDKFSFVSL